MSDQIPQDILDKIRKDCATMYEPGRHSPEVLRELEENIAFSYYHWVPKLSPKEQAEVDANILFAYGRKP